MCVHASTLAETNFVWFQFSSPPPDVQVEYHKRIPPCQCLVLSSKLYFNLNAMHSTIATPISENILQSAERRCDLFISSSRKP